jgi:collagenase-like PrtC family protease
MRLSAQTDNLECFTEAVKSRCSDVRLGSEFCEVLLPTLGDLEQACTLAQRAGKAFTYVTPRLSDAGIEKLREQFALLNDRGAAQVVVNDLGTLNILGDYDSVHPHLGRHLFVVPARTPWVDFHLHREDLSVRRREWLRSLYSSTSLNYRGTMELYRSYGCQGADIDWLPRIFPSLAFLVENGLRLSVHLHLVPATFTRRCHTARFLGESSPEECSKPCLHRAFLLRNEPLGTELYLHGNAAFRVVDPTPEEVEELGRQGVDELVLTMNALTRVDSADRIDGTMSKLGLG